MDTDVMLVTGMALSVLSLPSIVAAWADGRAPRVGAVVLLSGGGLILWALREKDGGYDWALLPDVVYAVIGQLLR